MVQSKTETTISVSMIRHCSWRDKVVLPFGLLAHGQLVPILFAPYTVKLKFVAGPKTHGRT